LAKTAENVIRPERFVLAETNTQIQLQNGIKNSFGTVLKLF